MNSMKPLMTCSIITKTQAYNIIISSFYQLGANNTIFYIIMIHIGGGFEKFE